MINLRIWLVYCQLVGDDPEGRKGGDTAQALMITNDFPRPAPLCTDLSHGQQLPQKAAVGAVIVKDADQVLGGQFSCI